MAVITRFIVVRNGVELDRVFEVKKEAEAYDKMLDAADNLAAFIKQSDLNVDINEETVDAISISLAKNAPEVTKILKGIKPFMSAAPVAGKVETPGQPAPAKDKKTPEKKTKAKRK